MPLWAAACLSARVEFVFADVADVARRVFDQGDVAVGDARVADALGDGDDDEEDDEEGGEDEDRETAQRSRVLGTFGRGALFPPFPEADLLP